MQPATSDGPGRERGQILVLFALAVTAIMAMVGLVLDGGDTFAQRRVEQNVADVAAMAGANAYMNVVGPDTFGLPSAGKTAAVAAARAAAARNGFTNGVGDTTVDVAVELVSSGATVHVGVTRPHQNTFARVMGFNSWPVSVTATAVAGTIDTGMGAGPWTMNIDAFNPNGSPKYTKDHPMDFGEANGDYPVSGTDIAWTDFNGADNVDTTEVGAILSGQDVVVATFDYGQYLGQHNQGYHNALWSQANSYLAGTDVPIPIVGPGPCLDGTNLDGCFKGWAMFHLISATGGDSKVIRGYFLTDFISKPLTVGECTVAQQAAGSCGVIPLSPLGAYVVRLTN